MKHPTNCKICHKPMLVEADEDYIAMGDPAKLLPLATCNRCYDLRDRRIRAESSIERQCYALAIVKRPVSDMVAKFTVSLTAATQAYVRWFCDFHNLTPWQNCWSEDFVRMLIERPRNWHQILQNYRKQFRPLSQ